MDDEAREQFRRRVSKTFELAVKFKKAILKKGLRKARARCPDCPDKFLHGSLNGKKDHLHFSCDCGKYMFME